MNVRLKILVLLACFVEVVWLLVAQVLNNMYLLVPCLVFFLAIVLWASVKDMVLPVLLFFLPFSPLLKLQPGMISVWTIALLAIYLIYIVMGSKKINIYHLIPALCLIALCMVVKLVYGYEFDNSFILFSASLLMIPFLTRDLDGKYDFFWATLCFTLGIAIAAITAQFLMVFPTISRYIETLNAFNIIRRAGYYGDPNFYSTHITAALSGVLVMLLRNTSKIKMVALIFMSLLLLYCGFLSVSKTFMLITLCLVLFWFIAFLFDKGRLTLKIMMFMTLFIGILFLLSTTVFTDLVDMMLMRLFGSTNLSDFTTGRIELWEQYIRVLDSDLWLTIFGNGLTDILVNDHASHNILIQSIYHLGVVGCIFLGAWILCSVKSFLPHVKFQWRNLVPVFILLMGAIGPWMALDLLFFDEFFLMPIYVCLGVRYLSSCDNAPDLQRYSEE